MEKPHPAENGTVGSSSLGYIQTCTYGFERTCSSCCFPVLECEGVEAESERSLGGKSHTSLPENCKVFMGGYWRVQVL